MNVSLPKLNLVRALTRARYPILSVALVYAASVAVGIIMVGEGSSFALEYRDRVVGTAMKHDQAAIASKEGAGLKATFFDFAGNLVIGSVPKTLMGLGIIFPYPLVAFQGWVGGIVSVRGDHSSRINNIHSAIYYLMTLFLQIVAYSIAVGGGVNAGVALLRPSPAYRGEKWLRIFPGEAIRDMGRLYLVATPIFFIASLWEFMGPWNV